MSMSMPMTMPLVSILMAAFHAEDTIAAAVRSVRAQDHENWELIIASDCGADYLGQLTAHGIADKRLRMVPTPRIGAGPSAARNAALTASNGAFITILDSDDTWQPEKLSTLLSLTAHNGLACDNTRATTPDGVVIGTAHDPSPGQRQIDAVAMMVSGMPHYPLFLRDLAGPGYRGALRFAEDVVFNIELIARAGAMALWPHPLTNYIQRPASATNAPDAWRRAEAAYAQIDTMLANGDLDIPAAQFTAIRDAFAEKRQLNLAYGKSVEAGQATSFQDFLAARRGAQKNN